MDYDSKARVGFSRENARRLLQSHNITSPPVNVEALAHAHGYTVERRDWPKSVSGIGFKTDRLIGINSNHAVVRQRFTIAHELGHFLLGHRDEEPLTSVATIDDEPREIPYAKIAEEEANIFAGELLVPLPFLKKSHAKCKDPDRLADEYHVSRDVMFIQLKNHRLLFK